MGGALLTIAEAAAIIWANSPASEAYFTLCDFRFGYEPWHLELSVGTWAADGLLAIFFFMVGLELKREIVVGDLRRFSTAIVPITSAVGGGVVVPALIYVGIVWTQPSLLEGWAIPTATDIAFAVAILALVGSHLPGPLRIFLLTLAVVDDLIAIGIIAVFYTSDIHAVPLAVFAVLLAAYGIIAQRGRAFFTRHPSAAWLILLLIGLCTAELRGALAPRFRRLLQVATTHRTPYPCTRRVQHDGEPRQGPRHRRRAVCSPPTRMS